MLKKYLIFLLFVLWTFKNDTNKIFDLWSKLIKQLISIWVAIITASKNKTAREENREKNTREFGS